MKKLFLLSIFLLSTSLSHAVRQIVVYDPNTFNVILFCRNGECDSSQIQSAYQGMGIDLDPDLTAVENSTPTAYWKRQSPGVWVPMSGAEQTILLNAAYAASTAAITAEAIFKVDVFDSASLAQRGFTLVSLDEINNIRQWLAAFKVEVAASTSLADFRTRVATLPNTPDRTKSQIIPAIKNKISSGGAD